MAAQIGFPGLAPRSRVYLCFTMVEGSNRRREGGDVSRGFRIPRATDWQGPIGFFAASPFPTWRRTHFPSTLNSCLGQAPAPLRAPSLPVTRAAKSLFPNSLCGLCALCGETPRSLFAAETAEGAKGFAAWTQTKNPALSASSVVKRAPDSRCGRNSGRH